MGKTLDAFDIALLNLLQLDNIASAERLAAAVPLSASAIARRVRRLRERGLIAADLAMLSPEITGSRLKAIVHVQLHDHAREGGFRALIDRLAAAPEVQYCAEISGALDLAAIVCTRDMTAFNAFADAHLAADPAVRRYETSFVKRELKNRPIVPLGPEDVRR